MSSYNIYYKPQTVKVRQRIMDKDNTDYVLVYGIKVKTKDLEKSYEVLI